MPDKTRDMENVQILPVGEIARQNFNTIAVFRKYGIDFYSNGNQLLSEACVANGCDELAVSAELNIALSIQINKNQDYNEWPISSLIEYIIENHHQYANKSIPEISGLFHEVLTGAQPQNADLARAGELFRQLGNDMKQHMQKEELALFPFMKKLEAKNNKPDTNSVSVQSLISVVEMEHDTSGIILKQIASLRKRIADLGNPGDNLSLLTGKLNEFESDLIMHIHLENNILHKKALELEQTLLG